MTNDNEVFSFELNETLFFERGQEVAEMIGISLDPEISIQSYNEYVSIRGVIELHGEYEKDQTIFEDEDLLGFDEYHSKRFLEKVRDSEDGYSEFSHRFPVEISVPRDRIIDTNDVTVSVESFDYELSNQNELRITSMIHIHGISHLNENSSESDVDDEQDLLEEQKINDPIERESFEFEVKKEADDEEIVADHSETEQPVLQSDDHTEKDRWKYKEPQSIKEFLDKKSKQEETIKTNIVEKEIDEETTDTEDMVESSEEESIDEVAEKKSVSFLAKLFREDDEEEEEEESYSQMRICIVQENDTLETIAERYEVPKLQLLKQNRLEDDHLNEGQLLSIPAKKIRKNE